MKRTGNLALKVADPDNLRLAFWKAQKGKSFKANVIGYKNMLDSNLMNLREEILSANVVVGNYSYFTIFDPKERTICAADFHERVLQHALMNVCHDVFDRYQICHSYASRKGKGTYAAIEQAKKNQRKFKWYLKLDIRKYFDTIDHSVLLTMLQRKIKDRIVLKIFEKIIESYHLMQGKGLPIGNLTSQYFANHYLGKADHFVTEYLKVPAYIRYMDDMVLWGNDKSRLKEIGLTYREFITDDLKLTFKTFSVNKTNQGLPFCGYLIFPQKVLLKSKSKKRFIRKLKTYEKNLESATWSQKEYQVHVLPLLAFVKKANSHGLRKRIVENYSNPGIC